MATANIVICSYFNMKCLYVLAVFLCNSIVATGTGVDIYILADGVEDGDKEFGQGRSRAANIRYIPPFPRWRCTKYGTKMAILTAGNYTGIARNSRIYVLRYT